MMSAIHLEMLGYHRPASTLETLITRVYSAGNMWLGALERDNKLTRQYALGIEEGLKMAVHDLTGLELKGSCGYYALGANVYMVDEDDTGKPWLRRIMQD